MHYFGLDHNFDTPECFPFQCSTKSLFVDSKRPAAFEQLEYIAIPSISLPNFTLNSLISVTCTRLKIISTQDLYNLVVYSFTSAQERSINLRIPCCFQSDSNKICRQTLKQSNTEIEIDGDNKSEAITALKRIKHIRLE
jgi:hypothetical protein